MRRGFGSTILGRVSRDERDEQGEDESDGDHDGLTRTAGGKLREMRGRSPQLSLIRSVVSHCELSERITRSPGFRPLTISIVFTELTPSFTWVRVA
jgi:hypothetical protein